MAKFMMTKLVPNSGSSKYGTNYTTTNGNEEFTNIDNYEEYLSNLPMGIEPISEEEFYTRHSSNRYTLDKKFGASICIRANLSW